ncbi:NAD(P)/FAD-dependent oxidoreductase [Mameliella alba]|uniref:NAD(P)/FAD-dependent oxidoreductase n=1 Tax=Mameliella alba TaxID=561184 RepID=UPI000B538ACE|nr:FAD-dependent oxidoreductase [Mameliella alba]OWV40957.1 pyridine nucleotide-disulfide oxidoreductase [Mameliella alba]
MQKLVIAGGGQAGFALAAKARSLCPDSEITLICEEPDLPYQRPPLSKKYLRNEMAREQLYLRPEGYYADQGITLIRGHSARKIDRDAKRLLLLDNQALAYDQLALTTGARPRRLPPAVGGDLPGVYYLRNVQDVDRMAPEFQAGRRVLVIGGGYIGLEAAAVAANSDLSVTLVEMAPRILQRVAAPETSDFFRTLHQTRGVDIREGIGLDRLERDKTITARFSDGTAQEVDFVIVGIGIEPNDALARDAGLPCDGGIVVDKYGRTSDRNIWAAGDCTRLPYQKNMIRLESVQNAIDQAEAVAANMLGQETDYVPNPWFWSDQFDVKLQIAGLNTGYDRVVVRQAARGGQSNWYFQGERLLAVDAMNDPRGYMIGKRLIEAGRSPEQAQVSDPDADLKALL